MAWNPTYKINLSKVFSKAYSGEIGAKLRPIISNDAFKREYGKRVIDRIVERTQDLNIDKKGSSLGKYSKSYKESDEFKIYGKSDPVNLTLTGEMLASMRSVSSGTTLTIEMIGVDNKGKAQGHISGKLGKAKAKKRDFLGLPPEEEEKIMKQTVKDFREESPSLLADLFDFTII